MNFNLQQIFSVQQGINALSTSVIYATIGVGFALIYSVLKFSNFSHGGAMTACAFIGYYIAREVNGNLYATMALTALAGGVLNLLVEYICFRHLRKKTKQVLLFFVSSITMGMLLENFIASRIDTFLSFPRFFSPRYIRMSGIALDKADILMFALVTASIAVLGVILKKTRLGISLRALSMDAETTSLMGVNVDFVIMATFFIAGVFAALAGIFLGMRTVLSPQLGNAYIIKGFIVAILGGLGSLPGALWGALILGVVETLLTVIIGSSLTPVGLFFFAVIFLFVRPQGICGAFAVEKA